MMSIVCVRWRQISGAVLIKTRFLLNVYAHSMKEYNMNNKLNVFVWSRCAGACVLIRSQCAGACVLIRSQCAGVCVLIRSRCAGACVLIRSRCAGACVEMTNYLINGMSDWLSR